MILTYFILLLILHYNKYFYENQQRACEDNSRNCEKANEKSKINEIKKQTYQRK